MSMLAERVDAVIGGDTHRDTHALAMTGPSGAVIAQITISNDAAGYAQAIAWIAATAPGPRVLVGLEGTRSYGIGLSRAVQAAGLPVVEVERPARAHRRRGKSDPIDAQLAAQQVWRMTPERLSTPRADGPREALRILLAARQEMTTTRTGQINRLRALLLTGDDTDRALNTTFNPAQLTRIARRRGRPDDGPEQAVRRHEARRLALAITAAGIELADNHRQLTGLVNTINPALLGKPGVGPVSAAQALISFSHPGRCRNDAAFAALAGACPVPASSGRTIRHRLNRGGDRQLNRALHTIVLTRWRTCERTRAYIQTRRAQGKTDREIRRCLKRYVARELFKALNTTP